MSEIGITTIFALFLAFFPTQVHATGAEQVRQIQKFQEQQSVDTRFADYFKRLQINPKDPDAHMALGQAYLEKGLYEVAIVSFGRALQLNPKLASAHYALSKTYRKKKVKTWEVIELEKAISIQPENDQYRYELGVVFMEPLSYDWDKAKKQYKALKKLKSPLAIKLGQLMELE